MFFFAFKIVDKQKEQFNYVCLFVSIEIFKLHENCQLRERINKFTVIDKVTLRGLSKELNSRYEGRQDHARIGARDNMN